LTIQTAAESDYHSKSGALTKMSFSLDIAQGSTGGLCRYDVSANALAELFSPGLPLGLTPGKRRTMRKLRREMRHHLPALQQNHHHRVNNNERFASRIYHSPNSFQSDPRKPPGSAMEPTGFDNHGFDCVGFSSSCAKAPQPKVLRTTGLSA